MCGCGSMRGVSLWVWVYEGGQSVVSGGGDSMRVHICSV